MPHSTLTPKPNRSVLIAIVSPLLLILLWLSSCDRVESDWKQASSENTGTSYSAYIAKYPTGPHTAEAKNLLELTKFNLKFDAVNHQHSVELYCSMTDTDESSKIIEVPPTPDTPAKPAALVLAGRNDNAVSALLGGSLISPNATLVTLRFTLSNTSKESATFHLGDIAVLQPSGKQLRPVALSKGNSLLVARLQDRSLDLTDAIAITVKAGHSAMLTYCYATDPSDFPLRITLRDQPTQLVLSSLPAYAETKSDDNAFGASMAGAMQVSGDIPIEQFHAVDTNGAPIARFESVPFKKGDQLAVYMGSNGARSLDTLEGEVDPAPYIQTSGGNTYIGGKLYILQTITPTNIRASLGFRALAFESALTEQKGAILGSVVCDIEDSHYVLSVRAAN
jgi:hypothetical protein